VGTLMGTTHCGEVKKNYYNGQVIEEMLDEKNLVCLNNGVGTRIDVNTGKESVLDLSFK